jgi:hypothetical protein
LDDNKRKKHVYFLMSHCECSSDQLRTNYSAECLADRTIKRLLVVEEGEILNCNFIGLPQIHEVNEWMYRGIMQWMDVQREELFKYLSQPIEGIRPVNDGFFVDLCSIL